MFECTCFSTVRALKLHSQQAPPVVAGAALAKEYREENLPLVKAGACNLLAHSVCLFFFERHAYLSEHACPCHQPCRFLDRAHCLGGLLTSLASVFAVRNVRAHGVRVVVAINRFHTDTDAEIALVAKLAKEVAMAPCLRKRASLSLST